MKAGILIIQCLIFLTAWSQESPGHLSNQLFFKHLSVEEGLSQPAVNAIIRGGRGFVWIATEDGLNRYDGNEFKIYRHDVKDSTTIIHSVVYALLDDSLTNGIWVGTANGLSFFNRSMETFTNIPAPNKPGSAYSSLAIDYKNNTLWIANGVGGIRYLNLTDQVIHDLDHPQLKDIVAWTIKLKDDHLYIGTIGQGLKDYNIATQTVTSFNTTTDQSTGNEIRSLLPGEDHLWIGTQGGLYALAYETQTIKKHTLNSVHQSRGIWSLAWDNNNNIWVGTDASGLIIYSPEDHSSRNYYYSENDIHGLNDNTIRSILIESSGDAWLGTYVGGVNYHPELPIKFLLYKKEYGNPSSLSNPSVTAFAENGDTLWIGTDDGLNYMKDNVIHPYKSLLKAENVEVILSLLTDNDGGLWVGTYDMGLFNIDKTGRITRHRNDPNDKKSISSDIIWDLEMDSLGYIWVGTNGGLNRYNPTTREFENNRNKPAGTLGNVFSNMLIRSILISSDGSIWAGIYGDLIRYNFKTDQFYRYTDIIDGNNKIENVRVISLCEDQTKNVWIGTYGDGLCKYDHTSKKFSIINQQHGLPNEFILAMQRGTNNDLWMTTNKGLVHYTIQEGIFLTFDQNYGIQGNTFNRGSSIKLSDGRLAFGGIKGFNMFSPVTMDVQSSNLGILLTDFKIFNQSIQPGNKLLPQGINELKKIDLPYDDSRSISFQFSALHFVSPQQVKYEYKLENFSGQWQKVGKDHTVTFTSLNPGTYNFVIRASLNEQNWGPEKKLTIVIQPPWYATTMAKITGGFMLALLAFSFYHIRTRNLHHQKQKLQTLVTQQSREIKDQNDELAAQNEELMQRNEEMATQKEVMEDQNRILQETQRQMAELNESLEKLVEDRTQSLDDTIHQLNKTIRELDAFVYSASHDIIAPLKSIQGLITLSRLHTKEGEALTYLDYMEASIKKLDEIINNMIQFSRNSKLEVKREIINIHTEIESCIQDFKFMKGFDEIDFQNMVDPNVQIVSDKQRLRIILSNLIGNTIKYYDATKPSREVSIQYENGHTTWKLSIHDNGIGIDKKYLSKVFEMFYRGTDRAYGSGLGLYIVKETVDRLKGEIFIDSEKGQWTRFELIFPIEGI